ncbi:hypothetical protein CTheo_2078 [Ceratobasidium theobromae]|uniref:Uncharacterized protein n=1 Tax=Ceratobasidium theobromae TaxID=1582974 RepID=A0A5N5QTA1_9AGAM|nr:hypothetical protein CTheo_2078 [Ceratobasidium theobromae]
MLPFGAALAEQIQSEPAKSADEKRQMLELLKRFEEESLRDDEETDESDGIVSRLQGIDLDSVDSDTLWELLSEDEKQKFTNAIMNPSSADSKWLFDATELLGGHEEPWWTLEDTSQAIIPNPEFHSGIPASGKFNPLLVFNIFHLRRVQMIRAFSLANWLTSSQKAVHALAELEAIREFLLPLSPFLRDRKSTILFTSVDTAVTDWASRLSELPKPEFLQLLTDDAKRLFQTKPVVMIESDQSQVSNNDYCIRFLSDVLKLFNGSKKHAHIAHKLMFYLAFITSFPVSAAMDLVHAVERWQGKACSVSEDGSNVSQLLSIKPRVLIEEIGESNKC